MDLLNQAPVIYGHDGGLESPRELPVPPGVFTVLSPSRSGFDNFQEGLPFEGALVTFCCKNIPIQC